MNNSEVKMPVAVNRHMSNLHEQKRFRCSWCCGFIGGYSRKRLVISVACVGLLVVVGMLDCHGYPLVPKLSIAHVRV